MFSNMYHLKCSLLRNVKSWNAYRTPGHYIVLLMTVDCAWQENCKLLNTVSHRPGVIAWTGLWCELNELYVDWGGEISFCHRLSNGQCIPFIIRTAVQLSCKAAQMKMRTDWLYPKKEPSAQQGLQTFRQQTEDEIICVTESHSAFKLFLPNTLKHKSEAHLLNSDASQICCNRMMLYDAAVE